MSRSWKTAATLLGAAAAGTIVFDRAIELDIGMLRGEHHKPLPGDNILPGATVSFDRAITIQAPPEKVWPWLIQLGQDRAGFYSFTSLENLVGCNVTDSHNIMPAWQERGIGDEVPLHPDIALSVADIDPGSSLVLSSDGGRAPRTMDFAFTWLFALFPEGEATRIHVRERYEPHTDAAATMVTRAGVMSRIMTWRMLTTIRKLVEARD